MLEGIKQFFTVWATTHSLGCEKALSVQPWPKKFPFTKSFLPYQTAGLDLIHTLGTKASAGLNSKLAKN